MNFWLNVWSQLQKYFRDWLKETGGIGAYTTFRIDLSEAHNEQRYTFSGDQLVIAKSDSTAYVKLNDTRNENIDTTIINQINTPFNEFYITNDIGTGLLEILVGSEGIFNSYPARINAIITDPTDALGNIVVVGNAELAARLGFIYSFDRRGNVKWFDDCQGTINKWNIQGFTGGLAYETTDRAYFGSKAYRLETTANANSKVYVNTDIDGGQAGRFGFEILFAEMGNSQYLQMLFSFMDQTDYMSSGLRFDLLNDKIDIDPTNGGSWTKISDHLFDGNNRTYHHAKLVGDAVTRKWVRLILNGIEYDLSAYDWNRSSAGICQRVGLSINLVNSAATAAKMNIGGIVFTDNEP